MTKYVFAYKAGEKRGWCNQTQGELNTAKFFYKKGRVLTFYKSLTNIMIYASHNQ